MVTIHAEPPAVYRSWYNSIAESSLIRAWRTNMPFNESLADRVRAVFARAGVTAIEKRMMGGLCFMVDDKMCVGLDSDHLMVRLDPEKYDWALSQEGCLPMEFTGRPMRGFVWVDPEGYDTQQQLESWLELALEFNPRARSTKKKSRQVDKKTTGSQKRKKRS